MTAYKQYLHLITLSLAALLLFVPACQSTRTQADNAEGDYLVTDYTGRYKSKIRKVIKSAQKKVNQVRKEKGMKPLKFKARRVVILKAETSITSISDLNKAVINGESDGTIAWTAYNKESRTIFIRPVVMKPPQWAFEHEGAHCILMSNGVTGHPPIYKNKFKYWES